MTEGSVTREFRQELFDEHLMYVKATDRFRDVATRDKASAQAYVASLMAAQFAYGLVAALRLVETRCGAEVAETLASDVRHVMDDEWLGGDLADDLDQSAEVTR